MKNQNKKNNKGITLVALIITIIVLLILAVVAIGAITNDGIISKAKQARDDYGKAQDKENSILQGYLDKINDNAGNGNNGSGNENQGNGSTGNENNGNGSIENESNEDGTAPLVDEYGNDAKNIILSETENIDVYDEYGNKIVVPAGFMIRVDESTTYADHVTEGLVIEDASGNQFVWVPVGEGITNGEKTANITLGRYSNFVANSDGEYIPVAEDTEIDGYTEVQNSDAIATAKNLSGFFTLTITISFNLLCISSNFLYNSKLLSKSWDVFKFIFKVLFALIFFDA